CSSSIGLFLSVNALFHSRSDTLKTTAASLIMNKHISLLVHVYQNQSHLCLGPPVANRKYNSLKYQILLVLQS
ncbi:hypothetical protein, partial [Legionella pneumophila]